MEAIFKLSEGESHCRGLKLTLTCSEGKTRTNRMKLKNVDKDYILGRTP